MIDLSKTSDESLSKVIAEFLGWKFEMRTFNLYAEDDIVPTPQEVGPFWWPPDSGCNAPSLPDMVNDPAMTVMLMEKISADGRDFSYEWDHPPGDEPRLCFCISPRFDEPGYGATSYVAHGNLGRAVAEAFVIANKLEVR